jgi:hypothetical protein
MMDRRRFLLTSVAGVVAAPHTVMAQQAGKIYRIGLVGLDSSEVPGHMALREGLRDLGYEEGKNLIIEYRPRVGTTACRPSQRNWFGSTSILSRTGRPAPGRLSRRPRRFRWS